MDVCLLVERVARVFVYTLLLSRVNELPADVVEAEQSIFRMGQAWQDS